MSGTAPEDEQKIVEIMQRMTTTIKKTLSMIDKGQVEIEHMLKRGRQREAEVLKWRESLKEHQLD